MARFKDCKKPFWALTDAEKDAFVKQFDDPDLEIPTRPLTKAERARWEQSRKGPTVSVYMNGDKIDHMTIRLEPKDFALPSADDKPVDRQRAEIIRLGLRTLLAGS